MANVLILGARAPAALDHARRFTHQGWTTYVSDSVPCRISGWSKAVVASVALTSPRADPKAFVGDLNRAIARYRIDLVIPTCEEVFFLSRYRNALPAAVAIGVDEFEKLRMLHSKWTFRALAQECGGNPPPSLIVNTISEAREWAGTMPIVLKPEYSRFGVHVRIYQSGIPHNVPQLGQHGRWVAQHFCSGTELCSYSVADKGRLLAHCVYQPLHRLGKSSSFYLAYREAPHIRQFVEAFVAKIGFTGQISFDWIESEAGVTSVIECNPRAISGVHLFSLDDRLPAALTGNLDACVIPSNPKPRMLASIMLTAGLAQAVQSRKIGHWWKDFQTATDVLASNGDRMPLLGALRDVASFGRLAIKNKCSMREAATRDIEWDGQELVAL
jgi:hypothetical protein